jgi:hypothetical protein
MRLGARRIVLVVWVALIVISASGTAGAATSWVVALGGGSNGEAHAQALPAAPGSPAASCNSPLTTKTIKVTWSAVARATTYSVYDSTTTATGTYSLVASGVATTSWTSGTLVSSTNYWFEVLAKIGSNWSSVKSAPTGESTINAASPFCVQP